jgi:hypothetical protein
MLCTTGSASVLRLSTTPRESTSDQRLQAGRDAVTDMPLAEPSRPPMLSGMIVVSEVEAAAIRAAYELSGELSAAVELRRRFPGIASTAQGSHEEHSGPRRTSSAPALGHTRPRRRTGSWVCRAVNHIPDNSLEFL